MIFSRHHSSQESRMLCLSQIISVLESEKMLRAKFLWKILQFCVHLEQPPPQSPGHGPLPGCGPFRTGPWNQRVSTFMPAVPLTDTAGQWASAHKLFHLCERRACVPTTCANGAVCTRTHLSLTEPIPLLSSCPQSQNGWRPLT